MANRLTMVIGDGSTAAPRQIAEAFQAAGVEVVSTVHDGLALVEAVAAARPSLVVLDLILPRLSGLQAIEALRRRGLSPTLVVATAVSAKSQVTAAKEAGVSFYFLKPIDPAHLTRVASRLVGELAARAASGGM